MLILATLAAALVVNSPASHDSNTKKLRLAQSSTVTNCMMNCNSAAANCQTSCVLPPPLQVITPGSSTPIFNATTSTACAVNCSSTQLACQTGCAAQSPSP
jgi:hypothetical protein